MTLNCKLIEENVGGKLAVIGRGIDFLDTTQSIGNKSKHREMGLY